MLIDGSPWNCLALSMSAIAATAIDSRAFGGIVYTAPGEVRRANCCWPSGVTNGTRTAPDYLGK